jgi:hypothetical protein
VAFDVGLDAIVGVSLDSDASAKSSSSRFRFLVRGEFGIKGGAGRNVYSGWYMIARYQWRLEGRNMNAVRGYDCGVRSLFVDRNHKVLLVEHIDLGRPLSNALVTRLLADICRLGPASDSHWKQEYNTHSLIASFL